MHYDVVVTVLKPCRLYDVVLVIDIVGVMLCESNLEGSAEPTDAGSL